MKDTLENSPFDGDLESELRAAQKKGVGRLTVVLGACVVLAGGVLLGIQAQKAFGSSAGASSGTAQQAGVRPGGMGQTGQMGQNGGRQMGGFGGQATVGTVTKIDGDTLTVRTQDGTEITVTTTDETAVLVTGKLSELKKGGTITVQGATGDDGSVSATTIREGAAAARPPR
ncbi:hypothetical protein ACIBH1_42600 [Nonomuraea sp. NPDC050663]|uniref:hypothetical protein n=1 Tax=Nonomuraea sp. NPDC050663 TaxID=3364370 RepID=UPI0037A8901F